MGSILLGAFPVQALQSGEEESADTSKQYSNTALAQVDTPQSYSFFRELGANIRYQALSPLTMNSEQMLYFGGGALITGILVYYDQEIDDVVKPIKDRNPFIYNTSPIITEIGGTHGIIATAAVGLYGGVVDDAKARQTALLLTEAIVTSGLWTRMGKILFSRERPSAAYEFSGKRGGRWYWAPGFFSQRFQSVSQHDAFPSGHTATAFAMAAVIDEMYGEASYVAPIAYSVATIVGITRTIEHTHWASDVFLGGIVGYLCGKQVSQSYHRKFGGGSEGGRFSLGMIGDRPAVTYWVSF